MKKWIPKLYLHQWQIELMYQDSDDEDRTAIFTEMEPRYMSAVWSVYPSYFNQIKWKREEIVVHELFHCITAILCRLAAEGSKGHVVTREHLNHFKEEVTQHLTNIVMRDTK